MCPQITQITQMAILETRGRGEGPAVVERRPGTAEPDHRSERERSLRWPGPTACARSAGLATPSFILTWDGCLVPVAGMWGGTDAPRARRPVGSTAATNARVRSRRASHRQAIVRSPTVPPSIHGTADPKKPSALSAVNCDGCVAFVSLCLRVCDVCVSLCVSSLCLCGSAGGRARRRGQASSSNNAARCL